MDREQFEFRISQYADGTLAADEVAALEAALAEDAEARALLDEYRRLETALKRELPVPSMNYQRLAAHLSQAIAEEDAATTTIAWPMPGWRKLAAAAAVVLIAGTAALLLTRPRHAGTTEVVVNPPDTTTIAAIVEVTGPVAQSAAHPVAEITVGPSQRARQANFGVAEDVVFRPPRIVIASGQSDRQDTQRLPF
jgi:negative regulator of sigma E activity